MNTPPSNNHSTPQAPAMPFWSSMSLEDLATQQGIGPVTDLDQLAELWPGDDEQDDLLEHLLAERAHRRNSFGEAKP